MARSKRPLSPETDRVTRGKRARVQQLAKEEVIVIDDDDEENDLRTTNKPVYHDETGDDSDIEIIEGPVEIDTLKKGKGKRKASRTTPSNDGTSRTRILHNVEDVAGPSSEVMESDAEMALRLAREWAAEGTPEPQAQAGSSRQTDAYSQVDTIESWASNARGKRPAPQSQTPQPSSTNGKQKNLDIPYITLPNPELSLVDFMTLLTTDRSCSKCGTGIKSPRGGDFHFLPEDQEATTSALCSLLHVVCPKKSCGTAHCRGCFNPVSCLPLCVTGPDRVASCQAFRCCAEVRTVALFEALSAFDRQYLAEKASAEAREKAIKAQPKTHANATVGPGGTGYASGYGGEFGDEFDDDDEFDEDDDWEFEAFLSGQSGAYNVQRRQPQALAIPEPTEDVITEADRALIQALSILTELLPAPYRGDEPAVYDLLPHPSVGALILLSFVPTVLAQHLRNDSVTDWISRSEVYYAMLTLLKALADCELTVPVLVGRRPEFSNSSTLSGWMWEKRQISWKRNEKGEVEMALPLLEHFKKLKRQAETFLRTSRSQFSQSADGEVDEPSFVVGSSLCSDIVGAQEYIQKAMETMHNAFSTAMDEDGIQATYGNGMASSLAGPSSSNRSKRVRKPTAKAVKGKGKEKSNEAGIQAAAFDLEKEYVAACEKLAFDYVSLATPSPSGSELVYEHYNFANDLRISQNSTRIPKARTHFAKELAVMVTSLPPGIWVRVDEVRNDAIKVMIAGPQGTPYAGGLFEFDCFIPLEYPNKPPVMHNRTTGGGTVRFNPNLYDSGKVCLSLLGTWSGSPEEQWTSKSTLLQVLVSIQSMILNEAPWYNEPGHGQVNLKSQQSISYNRDIASKTVRWAMVDWFKNEHRDGIWRDVIKSHFTLRKEKILQQIAEWAKVDPQMRAYRGRTTQPPRASITTKSLYAGFQNLNLPPPPSPSSSQQTMDLLAEVEQGIRQVEAWPSEG
ncbi:hypothetical protein DFP72DRAFT_899833 [Ephemerocybe angulata]|uniref:UBC core domain-containing protein n=1 Tax=Ephemerocybe angulata TaxID=980116 RepID=A0A8H6HW24_9AGAR|nr:hypothetical protein DFP72DRAFT_899833 [Tulosesus angulatus]